MSALLLCLCAIVLVSSVACRENAEVVHPVSGETRNDPTEGVPNVGRVTTPAESLPRSLSASPVADTQNAVELPRRDQQLAPTAQPTVQAVRATDSAEPARPGLQPSLVAQPALAGGPTVTSETQGGDGSPTRAAEPTPNETAVSGSAETVSIGIPRHHHEPVVNMGFDYLYGELFEADGCLRISYLGPYPEDQIPAGIWIIWPPGFTARRVDGVIEVVSQDGLLMARVGDRIRISGEWPGEVVADPAVWDWSEDAVRDCGGSHWHVGDEVSVVADEPLTIITDAGIVVPRLEHQEGPHQAPAGLLRAGRLVLRGRCLRVENTRGGAEHVVVWPPGFRAEVRGNRVVVTNGGGAVIVRVGDKFSAGGGVVPIPDSPDCSGTGLLAFTILPLD